MLKPRTALALVLPLLAMAVCGECRTVSVTPDSNWVVVSGDLVRVNGKVDTTKLKRVVLRADGKVASAIDAGQAYSLIWSSRGAFVGPHRLEVFAERMTHTERVEQFWVKVVASEPVAIIQPGDGDTILPGAQCTISLPKGYNPVSLECSAANRLVGRSVSSTSVPLDLSLLPLGPATLEIRVETDEGKLPTVQQRVVVAGAIQVGFHQDSTGRPVVTSDRKLTLTATIAPSLKTEQIIYFCDSSVVAQTDGDARDAIWEVSQLAGIHSVKAQAKDLQGRVYESAEVQIDIPAPPAITKDPAPHKPSTPSPLVAAIRLGDARRAQSILKELSASQLKTEVSANHPLHAAVRAGSLDTLKSLLGAGVSPDDLDEQGTTPIHVVVLCGRHEMIAALASQGARLDMPSDLAGLAAVHLAVMLGDTKTVHELLRHGASPEARWYNEVTGIQLLPLDIAINLADVEMVSLLLARGASPNRPVGSSGLTPLHLAAVAGNAAVVELLVKYKANIESRSSAGLTPLLQAAYAGNWEIASLLVRLGANVHAKDPHGSTALLLSAHDGLVGVCQLLLQKHAATDVSDVRNGRTPLHVVASTGNSAIARLLLLNGANVNARDSDGRTPLQVARASKQWPTAEVIRQAGGTEESEPVRVKVVK